MPSVMIPDGYTVANGGGFIPMNQAPQYAQPQQAPQPIHVLRSILIPHLGPGYGCVG